MEKRRLEDLKKMTLEELKSISRPLEVGEIIQEGDWYGNSCFVKGLIGEEVDEDDLDYYRPIETPTDKPSYEIKLGWYQFNENVVGVFDTVEVVYVSSRQVVYATKDCGLRVADSKDFSTRHRRYLGTTLPEPGEWADPGEVKLSELPMRARFRNHENEAWTEGALDGFFDWDSPYSKLQGSWLRQCQVWRPST